MTATTLPDAHPFLPAAEGRRCAACRLVRRHGVHRGTLSTPAYMHNAHRSTYRESGRPADLRCPMGAWAARA